MYETSRLVRISLLISAITKKKVIKAIENFFPVFCILTLEGLGKFSTVMQTVDFILGLHVSNSPNPSHVYIRLCKQ